MKLEGSNLENNPLTDADSYEIVAPNPGALVESLRAVGYTLEAAIADLIDNSVTAGAKNIWVDCEWNGKNSLYLCAR